MKNSRTVRTQLGLLSVIVILFFVGCLASPYFFRVSNFQNIVRSLAVTGILALGETIVILTGGIDLSVGGVLAFSAMVSATYASSNMFALTVVALLTGFLAGSVSGLGVITGRMPPFVATLATLTICRGSGFLLSNSMPKYFNIPRFTGLSKMLVFGIPFPGFVFLVVALILVFVLRYLPFGRALYAVGASQTVARFSGIQVKRTLFTAYALAGLLSGLAAVVYTSYTSVAQADAANSYELDAIAMAVVGGTSLSGGMGSITGTILGVIIMAMLRNIFNLLNFQSPMQQILMGVALSIAVLIQSKSRES